jgi:hypothetical protein
VAIGLCFGSIAGADEAPAEAGVSSAERPSRWNLTGNIGSGGAGGDFSDILKKPISGEFGLARGPGASAWA